VNEEIRKEHEKAKLKEMKGSDNEAAKARKRKRQENQTRGKS